MGAIVGVPVGRPRREAPPLWQIVATCFGLVVVAGFVIWLGIFLWARYAILIVTNLTWGLAAIGWASVMTVTEVAPTAGESKRGPRSIRAKLFGLFTAGIGFCVGIPLIYDAFHNPILPSHRPGGTMGSGVLVRSHG